MLYEEITGISREADNDAWVEWRRSHVGSSDICTIVGLNPYQTPLELWCVKTGKMEPPVQSPAMKYGSLVEKAIIEIFADLHPEYRCFANEKSFRSLEYPFATATPDCLLFSIENDAEGILECKHTAKYWDDAEGVPDYAHCQLMWQMGVMGMPWGHIGAVCAGRVNDFKDPYFEFEPDIFDALVEAAASFMASVQNDTPPKAGAGDSQTIKELIELRDEEKKLEDEKWLQQYRVVADEYKQLSKAIEELKDSKKGLENLLVQTLNGANVGRFPDGSKVSVKKVHRSVKASTSSFLKFTFKEGQNGQG